MNFHSIYRINTLFIFIISYSVMNGQNTPNILWLVCEDQSLFFSAYGDSTSHTPHLDTLANHSTIYTNCFTPSPVCSPSRSSIITGMYPTNIGTQNMRSYKKNGSINPHTQLPYYSPNSKIDFKFFTEYLRVQNFYCTNNAKEDYNMETSPLAWDESSKNAHWRNRQNNQPFFAVFNFGITHESSIWNMKYYPEDDELSQINLPIIFPNSKDILNDFYTNYKNIEKLDEQIGCIIQQLKEDNLYDNTIIFFFSDHGGPFPRYKRSIYDTGIHCPLYIKWENSKSSTINNQLISFVDFAPTILDIINFENAHEFDGVSFFQKDNRSIIYAATDRFDMGYDTRRCVRDKHYKLIFNSKTETSIFKNIEYRTQMKTMQVLDSLNNINLSNEYFNFWYRNQKSEYEFYDIINDPYELNNLIHDSSLVSDINRLKTSLETWMQECKYDSLSESEILDLMYPNKIIPLKACNPEIEYVERGIKIYPSINGASIGYKNSNDSSWKIYENEQIIHLKDVDQVIQFKPGYEVNTINITQQ